MKIAILGIRGLPSTYSGYETFIGELAPRLQQRGHPVTIYCRRALFAEQPAQYLGMSMRYLPSIEHKFLSTLSHTGFAILDASFRKFDMILVVNAANGLFGFIPRVLGKKCVLNVNGMEWLRPKWNAVGKSFFKNSARLGTWFYNEIVTDADEMHRLYAREFGIDSTYIAYGANIEKSEHPEALAEYGLKPQDYYLIASRLIPDNNADLIVEAFVKSGSPRRLVIAGGADYAGNVIERQFIDRLKSLANDRVQFTGHISKPGHIKELHCHCYAYVHGHQFGGINPSILKALGFGNLVIALDTPFNREVLADGKHGLLYEKNVRSLAEKMQFIEGNPALANEFRRIAPDRIRERFTWEQITDQYENLFLRLLEGKSHRADASRKQQAG
jgi:glycosyltransferase involved in cell wall biosynthesis